MFRTVPLSIIRSFSLYTQQWYMSYSLRAGSGRNWFRPDPARKLSANLYDDCCFVQPKHVAFWITVINCCCLDCFIVTYSIVSLY